MFQHTEGIGSANVCHEEGDSLRVEVSFSLTGATELPIDHGYPLFSACSRILGAAIHGAQWLAILPLEGLRTGTRLELGPQAALRMRLNPARLATVLPLAGAHLDVCGRLLRLGDAKATPLVPCPAAFARLVTICGFTHTADAFLGELHQRLHNLGVRGSIELGTRRTLRIVQTVEAGWGVRVSGLDRTSSLRIQSVGVGGRQRFGCGSFVPSQEV